MSKKIRSVIIEDEPDNRINLKLMLEKYCPNVEVIGEAENVELGIEAIKEHKPDLVFLDVEMPDGTGFDLLAKIDKLDFKVIFATAYSHYAIRAIRFNALDYILKPIDISELVHAVSKAQEEHESDDSIDRIRNLLSNMHSPAPQNRRIPLASAESLRLVELKDIVRLQGENNYTRFYLEDGSNILVSKTIKDYEEMLIPHDFMRVHQSHVVNLSFIKSYVKTEGGYLLMQDESQVGVSRARKNALLEYLQTM